MSQGPLCPNLTQKFQKEVSQIANRKFPLVMLLGGLSVNLNHLKMAKMSRRICLKVPCVQMCQSIPKLQNGSKLPINN